MAARDARAQALFEQARHQFFYDPSSESIILMCLVGGPFHPEHNFLFKSGGRPEKAAELIKLLTEDGLDHKQQFFVINELVCFFAATRNLHMCREYSTLSTLIEVLPQVKDEILFEKTLLLLEILLRSSSTVQTVKQCLSLLGSSPLEEERKILLLSTLQNAASQRVPRVFFDFDGIRSSLQLANLEKWPSFSYSISLWFCVEDFEDPFRTKTYEPRLFSFMNDKGNGLEAFFLKRKLYIRTSQGNRVEMQYGFESQRWYHLVVAHSYNKMEWLNLASSTVKVYVDGKLECDTKLKYPDVSETTQCHLGESVVIKNPYVQIPKENTFYGQMGFFLFFGEAITSSQVLELYILDFNYVPNFLEKDILSRNGGPSVLLAYHPGLSENNGAHCNLAQYQQMIFPYSGTKSRKSPAKRKSGCLLISCSSFKDVVHCGMGVDSLLPLIFQKVHPQVINSVLMLMSELIYKHPSNQVQLVNSKGYSLIGFLLQKNHVQINALTVAAVDRLLDCSSDISKPSGYTSLLLNFDIWVCTDVHIHNQIFSLIVNYVAREPSTFRSLFGIQFFLDIIRNYYWTPEESKRNSENSVDMKNSLLRTLTPEECRIMRGYLLHCIDLMLSVDHSIDFNETTAFVHMVQDCTDPDILEDILQLLGQLLAKPTKNLVVHLDTLGAIRPFLSLLYKPSEVVKIQTIRVTGRYTEQLPSKTRAKLLSEYLCSLLGAFSMTQGTYEALVELLLNDFATTPQELNLNQSKLLRNGTDTCRVVNPVVLGTIFRLLEAAPLDLKQSVVQEFIIVVDHARRNSQSSNVIEEFVTQFGWQGWLISLLITHKIEANGQSNRTRTPSGVRERGLSRGISQALKYDQYSFQALAEMIDPQELELETGGNEMILRLLTSLLRGRFMHRDGWRQIEETETFVAIFTETTSSMNREILTRCIYRSLVVHLQEEITKSDAKSPYVWRNLVNLLGLVYEFVFLQKTHRSAHMMWSDLVLAQHTLDLFDLSLRPPSNAHLPKIDLPSSRGRDIFMMMLRLSLMTLQELHRRVVDGESARVTMYRFFRTRSVEGSDVDSDRSVPNTPRSTGDEEISREISDGGKVVTNDGVAERVADVTSISANDSFEQTYSEEDLGETRRAFWMDSDEMDETILQDQNGENHPSTTPLSTPQKMMSTPEKNENSEKDINLTPFKILSREVSTPTGGMRNSMEYHRSTEDLKTDPKLETLFYKNVQRCRHMLSHLETSSHNTNTNAAVAAVSAVSAVSGAIVNISGLSTTNPNALTKEDEASCQRLVWVLSYLFKVVKRSLVEDDGCYLIVVPLIKEILRNRMNQINTYLGEFHFSDPGTAILENSPLSEFMEYYRSINEEQLSLLDRIYSVQTDLEDSSELGRLKSEKEIRVDKNIQQVRSLVKKEQMYISHNKKRLDSECFALFQRQRGAEVERRATAVVIYNDQQRSLDGIWKKAFRNLTGERTCWYPTLKAKNYYKMDPTENSQRQRLRMKRNYFGSDHKEASLTYRANLELQEKKAEEEEPLSPSVVKDNEEDLLKALSSIKITVSSTPSSVIIEEFEFEENDLEDSWLVVDGPEVTDNVRLSDKIRFSTSCEYVNPLSKVSGRIVLTQNHLHFLVDRAVPTVTTGGVQSMAANRKRKDKKWTLQEIVDIQKRRYLLRNNAIEIFFKDHRSYLFDLPKGSRKKILAVLSKAITHGIKIENSNLSASELLKKSGHTGRWQRREISNFEYLMILNTFAGRTYNDLTQYPVFPWVIKDYKSSSLDLNHPETFRDFSKPIGALNEERLKKFLDRKDILDDPNIPPFLYGSHYSTIGSVLFFLVRMEPFTTQFLENIQGGKFDIPDRMFFSIATAWQNVLASPSDVKELVPEFFYMPEFLKNSNSYDLGVKQDGDRLDDVVLPPWASTPEEFVRINREALESEFVSSHLSDWIDLIFGYKQRGKAAEASHNLFYYLTYEGSVDIDSIEDPIERAGVESQIANFGQTPTQLLFHPHPRRDPKIERVTLYKSNPRAPKHFQTHVWHSLHHLPFSPNAIHISSDSITAISTAGQFLYHRCSTLEPRMTSEGKTDSGNCVIVEPIAALPPVVQQSAQVPFFLLPEDPETLILCSKGENSLKLFDTTAGRTVQSISEHKQAITCFGISEDCTMMASGSDDCTVCVWRMKKRKLSTDPVRILRGHDEEVTAVCLSIDLDVVVSSSKDGTIIICALQSGRLVKSMNHPQRFTVTKLCLTSQGKIVAYSDEDNMLHLYNLLGTMVREDSSRDNVRDMVTTRDGEHLITGGGKVIIRHANTLDVLFLLPLMGMSIVERVILSKDEDQLFVLGDGGKLSSVRPNTEEKERMKSPQGIKTRSFVSLGMYG
ncbi:BEACH domain-containing protein [Planoprotostelium fungivorum]|uniref:BEACH domain-containing protein n=1 Tax=Planoprotostelium fungivorum TaxID=1890364 RepID=A0A2P6NKZ1_9EUKA|nr:BEACH domain-containing protein [Planoprotostelium fungivorum]